MTPAGHTIPSNHAGDSGTVESGNSARAATCEIAVGGMDCAGCATTIENALKSLDGVNEVAVNVIGGKVRVSYAEGRATRVTLGNAIKKAGFQVADEALGVTFWSRSGRLTMSVASGATLALGLLANWSGAGPALTIPLLAISSIAGGWFVIPQGFRAARNGSLDMNFLMGVAAIGAWIIGERTEAAATLFLFSIAELLESYSMDRARNAIRSLLDLSPPEATVRRSTGEVRVPVSDVAIGETVVVRPGEKISVDGKVTAGRTSVNQSAITGESMPVDKEEGAEVFAGTLNGQGTIDIHSTKRASDTTLARIIHTVEEAQASRAPSQSFVDRFARIYTPVVVIAAVLIAIVPPLIGAGTWETWIYRALTMLVVACPCALVISTPVTIVSGLTGAASAGILIKGGIHLENAGSISTVCFDKTGTLTEGRPLVTDVKAIGGSTEQEVLEVALALEHHSEHPLAQAIIACGRSRGLEPGPAKDFEALPGRGARAVVAGTPVQLGNERLAAELGAMTPEIAERFAAFEVDGKTAVIVMRAGRPLGFIAIADKVRPVAREAVALLRSAGISRILMLTGDNEGTARAVAASVGIEEFRAGLLPDDKVRIVADFERRGERTAFVGDGVNDAPALAVATVGIAMGAAGTGVAIETADIALMSDDLLRVAEAIHLSRRTLRIIKQNIVFSIAIKAVFLVLALAGWATLWMAVAADMGASLAVVANGLRARRLSQRRAAGRAPVVGIVTTLALVVGLGGCSEEPRSLEGEPTSADRQRFSGRYNPPSAVMPVRVPTPSTGDADRDFLRRMSDHHLDLLRITHAAIESNRDPSLAPAIRKFEEQHDHELDALLGLLQSVYGDAYAPLTNPDNDLSAKIVRSPRTDNTRTFLAATEKSAEDAGRILREYLPKAKERHVRSIAEKLRTGEESGMKALRKALSSDPNPPLTQSTR